MTGKKIYQPNGPKKQAGVTIIISNKIDFKLKSFTGKMHQEEISILRIYAPNTGALSYVNKTFLKLKSYIKPHTIIVGDFNTPIPQLYRSVRQKMNREIRELTDSMTQMDLTEI